MARYVLREDLSFCEAGGRLVFLDIEQDRYLRLPAALEATLVSYLSGKPPMDLDVSELVARDILVEQPAAPCQRRPTAKTPTRSAMEMPSPAQPVRILEALEVLVIVTHTQLTLKLRPFRQVLDLLTGLPGRPPARSRSPRDASERNIIEAAAVFRRVRLYIPIGMRCLVDSVAMARFLRRRGLRTRVVFGVAVDPFSAHCWVQAGDLVLNDTLGNVTSHTPIRVV